MFGISSVSSALKLERLLVWSRGRFLCIALTNLLNGRFIVAIDLRCLFTFGCGLSCGGCRFFAYLKLVGQDSTYYGKSGKNPDQELCSQSLLHGRSLF
jgi:hypothetical protein